LTAAAATVAASETEDVDVAKEEHESWTSYEIIGKEGKPSINCVVTHEEFFSNKKIRNDVIDWKKKFEEKCFCTIVPTKVLSKAF
jgi:hypothetical protein